MPTTIATNALSLRGTIIGWLSIARAPHQGISPLRANRRHFDANNKEIDRLGERDAREAIRLVRVIAANPEMELGPTADLVLTDPLIPPSLLV
jgi:hypothetical protein